MKSVSFSNRECLFGFIVRRETLASRSQMEIAVDVGKATVVPNHLGAFDLPRIPNLIGSDVVFSGVPRNTELLD